MNSDPIVEAEIVPQSRAPLVVQTPGFDRFLAVVKVLVIGGLVTWASLSVVLRMTVPGIGWRRSQRIARLIAFPTAALLAARRYLKQYYQLRWSGDDLELVSVWGTMRVDPHRVQGIVGAGGVNLNFSEAIVWRTLVLVADGRRYVLTFEPAMNSMCYWRLREICLHAWGIPFQGALETPRAGPELDTEEYVDALAHVRSYYLQYTQKSLVTGLLMMAGGVTLALAIWFNVKQGGPGISKLVFGLVLVSFVGLLLTIRTIRQLPVLYSLRKVQQRLREAI
jgi:hypothetical protein